MQAGNPLSVREQQVLDALAEGLTCATTGQKLKIASNTVADYKKTLFTKLNVCTSAHAVAEGFRKGLIK